MRTRLLLGRSVVGAVLGWVAMATVALAVEPVYSKDGLGLSGYDAVAYFSESKAVPGSSEFEHRWAGVRWRFASAAHLREFAAAPEKYAPQYGGYCAYAVSKNKIAPADPEAWRVVDGKLYVNFDQKVRTLWENELPDAIPRADRNWPGLRAQQAR